MNRQSAIQILEQAAPVLTQVTCTNDLGYEFSAVVPGGAIYAMPGMLVSYSGGEWPPNLWNCESEEEHDQLMKNFLLDEAWDVTLWEDLSDEEIETLLEDVRSQNSNDENEDDQQYIKATTITDDIASQCIFRREIDSGFDEYLGTDDFPKELETRICQSIKTEIIFERCIAHQGAIYWIWRGQRELGTPEYWPVYFRLIAKDAFGAFRCYGYCAPHWKNIPISSIIKHIEGTEVPWGGYLHQID